MKNKVTLILPTHNRHHLLDGILSFLDEFEVKTIVMDSTQSPFTPRVEFKHIEYVHAPGVPPLTRFREAAERAQTPYAMLTADDIYPSISLLLKNLAFLEKNADYAAILGMTFFNRGGKISLRRPEAYNFQLDANCPATRQIQFFTYYQPLFYSLQRTECLRVALNRFPEGLIDYNLCELYFGMALVAQGKVATVKSFMQVTCDEPSGQENIKEVRGNSKTLTHDKKYYPEIAALKQCIIDYLVEEKNVPLMKATHYVNNALRIMFLEMLPKKKYFWMHNRPPKTFIDRLRFELNALLRRVAFPVAKPPKPKKTSVQDVLAHDPVAAEDYKKICELIGCDHQ